MIYFVKKGYTESKAESKIGIEKRNRKRKARVKELPPIDCF